MYGTNAHLYTKTTHNANIIFDSNKHISPTNSGQISEVVPLKFQEIDQEQSHEHFGGKTDDCWLILQLSLEQATCLIESTLLKKLVHIQQ